MYGFMTGALNGKVNNQINLLNSSLTIVKARKQISTSPQVGFYLGEARLVRYNPKVGEAQLYILLNFIKIGDERLNFLPNFLLDFPGHPYTYRPEVKYVQLTFVFLHSKMSQNISAYFRRLWPIELVVKSLHEQISIRTYDNQFM